MSRILSIVLALGVGGCAVAPPVVAPVAPVVVKPKPQSAPQRAEYERLRADVAPPPRYFPDDDKPIRQIQNCAGLFPRGSDAERLCLLRGMDRYIDHQTVPLSERYLSRDSEISVQVPRPPPPPQPAPAPTVIVPPPLYSSPYGPPIYSNPHNPNALVDCRIDPTPPCYYATEPQSPWPLHTPGAAR